MAGAISRTSDRYHCSSGGRCSLVRHYTLKRYSSHNALVRLLGFICRYHRCPRADTCGCSPDVRTVTAFDCGVLAVKDAVLRPLRRRADAQPLFVAILIMPLVVISIVPLLVAAVAQASSGWIAFISAFDALLACVDILGAGMVLLQIPATAIIRNQGWRTYWREHEILSA